MENLLEIKSLNTYYGESHILRDVDLNVKSGEMVCLIGRNGVGKTTLLKSLIGLLKQKKGDIYFIGESNNFLYPTNFDEADEWLSAAADWTEEEGKFMTIYLHAKNLEGVYGPKTFKKI